MNILIIYQIVILIALTMVMIKELINKKIIITFVMLSILEISTYIFDSMFELRYNFTLLKSILLIWVLLEMPKK